MKKALTTAVACIAIATSALAPAASAAQRHHGDREQFMQNYCDRHHNDSDCQDWGQHRDRWDDEHYHSWYQRHHQERDFGPADAAAAIFGFAAGAAAGAVAGSINGATDDSHFAACDARYRSYDPESDTYMGYDGMRHRCML